MDLVDTKHDVLQLHQQLDVLDGEHLSLGSQENLFFREVARQEKLIVLDVLPLMVFMSLIRETESGPVSFSYLRGLRELPGLQLLLILVIPVLQELMVLKPQTYRTVI